MRESACLCISVTHRRSLRVCNMVCDKMLKNNHRPVMSAACPNQLDCFM